MADIVEEIKSHRLSEVVEKFVHLKNEGAGRKKCCCPFHHEKTPSFYLDDRNGLYHCFGCGVGGDVFTFIQNYKHCDFTQAIDYICEILNIDKSKYAINKEDAVRKVNESKTFHQAMDVVAEYYKECLKENNEANDYVKINREINDDTQEEFIFGLADDDIERLIGYCKLRDVNEEMLLRCGIIREGRNIDGEKYKYLFFRDRIMIPIHNAQGKIVAFGGRVYKTNDNNAKYLNSSDNDYFKKGSILFNFHRSKLNIGKNKDENEKSFIVVEGYMDVITLWQNNFKTAIAPLGTSITENHLNIIFNYCQNPIFVFDNDSAGKRATMRACEMMFSLLKTGMIPRICILQGAKDVDEFLKKYTHDDLQNQFNEAKEIQQFIFDEKKQNFDLINPNSISLLQKEIFQLVNSIPDNILRDNYGMFFRNEFNKMWQKHQQFGDKKVPFGRKNFMPQKFASMTNVVSKNKSNTLSTGLDFLEKRIISVLLINKDLQDDFNVIENVVDRLLPHNQELLNNLNDKDETQKKAFCEKYQYDFQDKEGLLSNGKYILDNLIIQWELKKLDICDLPIDIKNRERKIILEKKKKLLILQDDF